MDEALLAHYDEIGLSHEYNTVLDRMRKNGHTPTGPGAPLSRDPNYRAPHFIQVVPDVDDYC